MFSLGSSPWPLLSFKASTTWVTLYMPSLVASVRNNVVCFRNTASVSWLRRNTSQKTSLVQLWCWLISSHCWFFSFSWKTSKTINTNCAGESLFPSTISQDRLPLSVLLWPCLSTKLPQKTPLNSQHSMSFLAKISKALSLFPPR